MLLTISQWSVYFLILGVLGCYIEIFITNMLIGLTVTGVCCHKISMNTKEKDIIKGTSGGPRCTIPIPGKAYNF